MLINQQRKNTHQHKMCAPSSTVEPKLRDVKLGLERGYSLLLMVFPKFSLSDISKNISDLLQFNLLQ